MRPGAAAGQCLGAVFAGRVLGHRASLLPIDHAHQAACRSTEAMVFWRPRRRLRPVRGPGAPNSARGSAAGHLAGFRIKRIAGADRAGLRRSAGRSGCPDAAVQHREPRAKAGLAASAAAASTAAKSDPPARVARLRYHRAAVAGAAPPFGRSVASRRRLLSGGGHAVLARRRQCFSAEKIAWQTLNRKDHRQHIAAAYPHFWE